MSYAGTMNEINQQQLDKYIFVEKQKTKKGDKIKEE